ncbi:MAG TPA: hypothetical protein VEZ70_07165 [Allosphingosinicella sp.]|nr:hypothetical protein [Allosphingosinicella sp.]
MKKLVLSMAGALAMIGVHTPAVAAANHYNKIVEDVHVHSGGTCILFRLNGVALADPSSTNEPWIALSRDHPAFAEMFAILLTGAASKRTMNVHLSGMTCSTPAAFIVALN